MNSLQTFQNQKNGVDSCRIDQQLHQRLTDHFSRWDNNAVDCSYEDYSRRGSSGEENHSTRAWRTRWPQLDTAKPVMYRGISTNPARKLGPDFSVVLAETL